MFSTSKALFRRPAAGGATDPSFAYVPLLLNTTSTNGQQNNTFLDSSTNNFTITRNGTPTQGSITPYWPNGQWSNYFNGSTDYLTVASDAAFAFGIGDFTIECWVYVANTSNQMVFVDMRGATGAAVAPLVYMTSSGVVNYFTGGAVVITGVGINANAWNHIAVSRSSSVTKLFINGTQAGSNYSDGNNYIQSSVFIGRASDSATSYLNGYISNVRLVKGVGVYTTTPFVVSTTPLTRIQSANINGNPSAAITGTQTSLLTCQSNRFIDNGTANAGGPFTITVNGTPRVQAFQPFSPTASYTTALYGGSGYFVASTSDTLLTSSSQIIPTGNFTIEVWVYVTSSTATQAFVSQGTSGSAGRTAIGIDNSSGAKWFCQVGGVFVYSSVAPVLNTWNYLAMTYNGATIALYLNGTLLNSASNTTSAQNAQLRVSGLWATPVAGYYLDGYLSNIRVSNTVRTVTSVPTSPFTNDANTSLLLNFTNAGIYDAAVQNNLITVGDAQVSTTITAQWPPTSMKFDGTGDWLTAIDNPQLQLGTGDFTIEGWFYLTANGAAYGIVSKGAASTGWSVNVTSGNRIQFSYTAANLTGATTTLAAATWYYFAVVRSGSATGNLKIYINGALEVTSGGAVTDNFNQTDILYVGASRTGTTPLNGYLEEIRITKAARTITESPTAAFPTR